MAQIDLRDGGAIPEKQVKELFAALVIMAVATTLMASPMFDRLVANRSPAVAD